MMPLHLSTLLLWSTLDGFLKEKNLPELTLHILSPFIQFPFTSVQHLFFLKIPSLMVLSPIYMFVLNIAWELWKDAGNVYRDFISTSIQSDNIKQLVGELPLPSSYTIWSSTLKVQPKELIFLSFIVHQLRRNQGVYDLPVEEDIGTGDTKRYWLIEELLAFKHL